MHYVFEKKLFLVRVGSAVETCFRQDIFAFSPTRLSHALPYVLSVSRAHALSYVVYIRCTVYARLQGHAHGTVLYGRYIGTCSVTNRGRLPD